MSHTMMGATGGLEVLREWTGWFCHKLTERSPQCGGDLFPVCFRCAGIELGLAGSYVGLLVSRRWRGRFPEVRVVLYCAAMMLPLMLDGLGNATRLWHSPGWIRGMTGLGVGLTLPWLLAPLGQTLEPSSGSAPKPSLEGPAQILWPLLGGGAGIVLLARGCDPVGFRLIAAAAAGGWVLFLAHFCFALTRSYGHHLARFLWCRSHTRGV